MSRRDLAKQFYDPDGWRKSLPPGWSPVLVLSLGAVAANYGNSVRSQLFDDLRDLSGGVKNKGTQSHVPIVTLSPGRKSGQVSVEISASANAPDAVDYIWASDAETGEIFSGRKFAKAETPKLLILVERGRRIVPFVHTAVDGVWEGESVVAQ